MRSPLLATDSHTRKLEQSATKQHFDIAKVREEIFQNWLTAEAEKPLTNRDPPCRRFTYQDGVKAYNARNSTWFWLDRELSSNMAGETGAVYLYKGALAALKILNPSPLTSSRSHNCNSRANDAGKFCQEHMTNEETHLQLFQSILPNSKYTMLLPVWRFAGWTVGFLATLIGGCKGLYVTVEAVETFVEEHYQQQIARLKQRGKAPELVRLFGTLLRR
jgi:demethoxyubiquinone hydroxylase (CLK1/Coq7/Cat5 family)